MLIGEVATRSGVSARMLRHYDAVGLVRPTGRTHGGYRRYAEADLHRLFHVEALRSLGLGLQEVAAALDDPSFDAAAVVADLVTRTQERLAEEQGLLHRLEQVQAGAPAAWTDVLRLVGLVRGLSAASPSTRQRAALSLATPGDAATLAVAVLDEPDPVVAGALGWALARTGDDAVPVLADALQSPVADRRHRAVMALSTIGSTRAAAALAEAVDHPDPLVAGRAALARGNLAGLVDDPDRGVALTATALLRSRPPGR